MTLKSTSSWFAAKWVIINWFSLLCLRKADRPGDIKLHEIQNVGLQTKLIMVVRMTVTPISYVWLVGPLLGLTGVSRCDLVGQGMSLMTGNEVNKMYIILFPLCSLPPCLGIKAWALVCIPIGIPPSLSSATVDPNSQSPVIHCVFKLP